MSGENKHLDLEARVRSRMDALSTIAPGSIGQLLQFRMTSFDPVQNTFTMTCRTFPWMCNSLGTLHGGMCATILDQAMGFVSNCLKTDTDACPTVQLNINYHSPLHPGEDVLVCVHLLSESRRFISLSAQAFRETAPEKICVSGTGLYYCK